MLLDQLHYLWSYHQLLIVFERGPISRELITRSNELALDIIHILRVVACHVIIEHFQIDL